MFLGNGRVFPPGKSIRRDQLAIYNQKRDLYYWRCHTWRPRGIQTVIAWRRRNIGPDRQKRQSELNQETLHRDVLNLSRCANRGASAERRTMDQLFLHVMPARRSDGRRLPAQRRERLLQKAGSGWQMVPHVHASPTRRAHTAIFYLVQGACQSAQVPPNHKPP